MATKFDPTKYGAIPVTSNTPPIFNPEKYGAVRTTPLPKEHTFKEKAKSWLKEFPKALGTVATQPFKHPIDTTMAVTAGLGDIGAAMANTVLKLSDLIPSPVKNAPRKKGLQLDYLSKALADSKPENQQDISTALSAGSKMWGEYALGEKLVGNLGVKNKIAQGVLGNVAGGQLAADPNSTLKERGSQALFDSVFGLVTEGIGPLRKTIFGKKAPVVEAPKPKLTPEEYAKEQGYEPIVPDSELPTIKMGRTPKGEPTVKYGSKPNVYDNGQPQTTVDSVLQDKGNFGAPSVKTTPRFDSQGFRPVDPNEVLPNGFTTKMNQTTGETLTNAPFKEVPKSKTINQPKLFEEAIQTATPKFKEDVVKLSKKLDDIPGFTPAQKVKEAAAFQVHVDNGDFEHIIKVAQGVAKDENMSAQTAFKLGEEYFDIKQDWKSLLEISKARNTYSSPGSQLSMLNQGEGSGGTAGVLVKAQNILEQKLVRAGINLEKEIDTYYDVAYKQLKQGKDVNQVINDLVDFLTCK